MGEEVWDAAPPWATSTHQQYAHRPAALGALEAAAIPYTGLTALVPKSAQIYHHHLLCNTALNIYQGLKYCLQTTHIWFI